MSPKQFNETLKAFIEALEQRYDDDANNPWDASDEFYYIAQDLEAAGIGKVYVPMPSGRMGWMNLEDFSF